MALSSLWLVGLFSKIQVLCLFIDCATIFSSSIISEKSCQTLHFIQIETYPMYPAMTYFVFLNIMFLRVFRVFAIDAVYSFMQVSSIQWNASTKNSFILFLSDIWVIFNVCPFALRLQNVLLQTLLY